MPDQNWDTHFQKSQDASMYKETAFAAAGASAESDGLYIGRGVRPFALEVEIPAIVVGELADAQTLTFTVEESSDNGVADAYAATAPAFFSWVVTGAGGAGADAATKQAKIPTDFYTEKYIRVVCASGAGAGDPTTNSKEFIARIVGM